MPKFINWIDLRWDMENTPVEKKEIALKYECTTTVINRKIKEENWDLYDSSSIRDQELIKANPILKALGLRKIREIIDLLGVHYSPIQEPLVVIYAVNYQMWVELKEQLGSNILIAGQKGNMTLNPLFKAIKDIEKVMLAYAAQLGLSVAAGKRLSISHGQQEQNTSLFDFADELNDLVD